MVKILSNESFRTATGSLWQDKVLDDDNPLRCGTGLIALCHSGVPEHQPQVFSTLQQFELTQLPLEQQLIMLRAYQLCFLRLKTF